MYYFVSFVLFPLLNSRLFSFLCAKKKKNKQKENKNALFHIISSSSQCNQFRVLNEGYDNYSLMDILIKISPFLPH